MQEYVVNVRGSIITVLMSQNLENSIPAGYFAKTRLVVILLLMTSTVGLHTGISASVDND